ncbi:MAG: SURF1 family protein [Gammaproteobacteria bacterium]|nr:SURF1 family protein [Gammaproteobacteria bacterium]MYD80732.1 SURF1 family protein [Gammaproteobacteria bacterium]
MNGRTENLSIAFLRPRGGWILAIQVIVAALTTLGLSTWQVTRGLEKSELRDVYVDRLDMPAIEADEFVEGETYYRKIDLLGQFDENRTFIVAYQRHFGQPGFWIITPFDTDAGVFLVNRGWVSVQGSWFHTPEVETPQELVEISGVVWPNLRQRSTAGYDADVWPRRVNRLNVKEMARVIGSHEDEIRLLPESEGVLVPIHLSFEQGASTHWSYAVQWLMIGILIVLGYWYFALRRTDEES